MIKLNSSTVLSIYIWRNVKNFCEFLLFSEHQEYMKQIHEAKDPRIREDLERELDILVAKMEAKGQQISKVRKHQQKVSDIFIVRIIKYNSLLLIKCTKLVLHYLVPWHLEFTCVCFICTTPTPTYILSSGIANLRARLSDECRKIIYQMFSHWGMLFNTSKNKVSVQGRPWQPWICWL